MKDYKNLIESTRARLNPDQIAFERRFSEELSSISYSDALTFVRLAMKSVEPSYTAKTKEAGEKVKDHLKSILTYVTYRYQGSVMTNTHIKGYSDIDLLTISDKFYYWDNYHVKQILDSYEKRAMYYDSSIKKMEKETILSPYGGNAYSDLHKIRTDSEVKLSEVYLNCDISKPKSIKITNRNLKRDVDIVTANWYDDVQSIINDKGDYRGIQVYDKHKEERCEVGYPFLSISRINGRSSETNGRLKKMIRFLKHCKSESSQDIKLTSFDINAICYSISISEYRGLAFYELVPVLYSQLKRISEDDAYANEIVSVDGREYIFRYNIEKRNNLKSLLNEVEGIFLDLTKFSSLAS